MAPHLPGQKVRICPNCNEEVTRFQIELVGGTSSRQDDVGSGGMRMSCNHCGHGLETVEDPIGELPNPVRQAEQAAPSPRKPVSEEEEPGEVRVTSTRDRIRSMKAEIKALDREIRRLDELKAYRDQIALMLEAAEKIRSAETRRKKLHAI